MATGKSIDSTLKRISKNHLECSICQERYDRPKILPCLHSFCEKCLNEYWTSRHRGVPKIPCPVCRQETVLPEKGVSGLKTNFFITSLMEDVTLQDQVADDTHALTCDTCDTGEATHRCLDCSKNICAGCLRCHKQFPDLLHHTVASLEDIRQGKVTAKKTKREGYSECEKHAGEMRRFFCKRCEELICRDCTVIDHPKNEGHEYDDLKAASSKLRQVFTDLLPRLTGREKLLQDALTFVQKVKEKLENNASRAMQKVRDTAATMKAEIDAEVDGIMDEIENVISNRNAVIDGMEKDAQTLLSRSKHSHELARDITSHSSDSDFLSLYPEIKRNLQALGTASPPKVDQELSALTVILRPVNFRGLWQLQLKECQFPVRRENRIVTQPRP
ncbi:E3 ubiquitin-protein ligase TRIM56-like [Acanthaster planci]|uniref:E3 ubiquitin-protein ligase TRIM56-like n=1 Tax=Acanthaster planci TaxID=133434 RepID=A0A8B7XJ16_ACAPL|nr:E3 ubiquitin-protein ligase TRIM56-like [Acanthaster planci]